MLEKTFVDLEGAKLVCNFNWSRAEKKNGISFLGHLGSWNLVRISDLRDF